MIKRGVLGETRSVPLNFHNCESNDTKPEPGCDNTKLHVGQIDRNRLEVWGYSLGSCSLS